MIKNISLHICLSDPPTLSPIQGALTYFFHRHYFIKEMDIVYILHVLSTIFKPLNIYASLLGEPSKKTYVLSGHDAKGGGGGAKPFLCRGLRNF